MISATRRWLRRNRTSFAIGFGVLGVGYVTGQYILSKISEARERMSSDRIARENLRRKFQQNQEDCTFTVLALLPTAAENILEALPVEQITHELQQKKAERLGRSTGASDVTPSEVSSGPPSVTDENGSSIGSLQSESYVHASQIAASSSGNGEAGSQGSRKSKAQLWAELKISSVTRAFTLIYTLSLLNLLTRIQLNLLGRRNYLSSVVSLASYPPNETTISLENRDDDNTDQTYGNDFETNRKFLTFSWWLLHRGWRDVMETVESAAKEVFGGINPREDVSFEKLSALTVEVRRKVEGATEEERRTKKWLPYLLPPRDKEDDVLYESGMLPAPPPTTSPSSSPVPSSSPSSSPPLRRLLDETSDLLDSPTSTHVLTLLLDTTFSHLVDDKLRSQAFKLSISSESNTQEASLSATTGDILNPTSLPQQVTSDLSPSDTQSKAKLATILAVITRQAHSIGNGVPNEYVQATEGVRELEAFAAVVYSSNFEFEALGEDKNSDQGGLKGEEEAGELLREGVLEGESARIVKDSEGGKGPWAMFEGAWERVSGKER